MKLLISCLLAVSVGRAVRLIYLGLKDMSHPSSDGLTQRLRQVAARLIELKGTGPFARYLSHIAPLIQETPLPPALDLPMFLALQSVAGVPLWVLTSVAFPKIALIAVPLCLIGGAVLPYLWLKQCHGRFHTALLKALPECLELHALVMEAGLDLTAGLQHYLDKGTPGALHTLFKKTQTDIQMGRSRAEAFSALGQRTRFAPLRDTCRGIVQALQLGTSLAPLLRQQAAGLRTRRMHIAEKKAAEAPLKILFPLFVFIFPTIFIVLLGPLVLMLMRGGF